MVLGLFAISQAFVLLIDKDNSPKAEALQGGIFQGFKELLGHKRVVSISASFGVVMGMIPGVGEFTAQFMSYTSARRLSKTPEQFGKGSPRGAYRI